ncbi:MAG TPA: opioid growth factor receptor-related protein [Gemmataceae bacterium]|nr:opioid growth factor receptor-related protein [Gemmataceae bacterium]
MSQLVEFYRGTGTDCEGRRLDEILKWGDGRLEAVHDFIQWLFPLPEPSRFNPDAPLLTEEDVAAFRRDPALRANLRRSFECILTFLGLAETAGGEVVEGPTFSSRAGDVWDYPNHNWLRITRILRSLSLLGLGDEARALYRRLEDFHARRRFPIGDDTFQYWSDAVGE